MKSRGTAAVWSVVAPGTNADFIIRYANRRKQLEAEPELRVNR